MFAAIVLSYGAARVGCGIAAVVAGLRTLVSPRRGYVKSAAVRIVDRHVFRNHPEVAFEVPGLISVDVGRASELRIVASLL